MDKCKFFVDQDGDIGYVGNEYDWYITTSPELVSITGHIRNYSQFTVGKPYPPQQTTEL